jgi:hypothetical protein
MAHVIPPTTWTLAIAVTDKTTDEELTEYAQQLEEALKYVYDRQGSISYERAQYFESKQRGVGVREVSNPRQGTKEYVR